MTEPHEVCPLSELTPGERRILNVNGRSIGVFNVEGDLHALTNVCPHQRAPLCEGELTGTTQAEDVDNPQWICDGQILRCPWHGWEFDVTTGESVFNPHRWRVSTYETDVLTNPDADPENFAVERFEVDEEDGIVVVYV